MSLAAGSGPALPGMRVSVGGAQVWPRVRVAPGTPSPPSPGPGPSGGASCHTHVINEAGWPDSLFSDASYFLPKCSVSV